MIFFLIIGLILGAVSVIFAMQNVVPVTVTLFNMNMEASLSLVILGSMIVGVLICILFTLPEVIINTFRFRTLKKENKHLEDELIRHKQLLTQATPGQRVEVQTEKTTTTTI
jgi:uncharacterized integral membrane protein